MVMAQSLHSFVLISSFLALSFSVAFSSIPVKSLHFSLYQHETLNKTGYIIAMGVETGAAMTQATLPFGSLFQFQDPMTTEADPSSKVVGVAEGTSITSSLDGIQSINIGKISLDLKNHKGSISVVGVTPNIEPGDLPVVGGTGDFLFVKGFATSSPVSLTAHTFVYKFDFHLYWPPYTT